MPTIAVKTLGCKVNQYDTEAMLEILEKDGYESIPFEEDADVYLVNTCTVTGTGDAKSLKLIRRLHREHPSSAIVAAGCLAQFSAQKVHLDGVVLAIGVQRRGEVASLLKQALETHSFIDATGSLKNAPFEKLNVSRHEGKTRATMKIQEGCDRYCSYCVIPYVRGPVRSMDLSDVRAEAVRLAEAGYKEIVLTGIHLASYGRDTGSSLLDAVREVCACVPRVRLGSLEPLSASEEFAKGLSELEGVCPQFHLSLQSGSDSVLKRMNRRYGTDGYLAACENLRKYFPGCAITTDVIAGFPGETEEEFEATCAFVEKAALARLHVFPYSRRSGTAADRLPDQIGEDVKKRRAEKLIEIGNRLELCYVKRSVGSCQSVLFETADADGYAEGHSKTYLRVRAKGTPGEINEVLITGTDGKLCTAEILK